MTCVPARAKIPSVQGADYHVHGDVDTMSRQIAAYAAILGVLAISFIMGLSVPLGIVLTVFVAVCLYMDWRKWRAERFAAKVLGKLLSTAKDRSTFLTMEMSRETIMAQAEIEERLRDAEPVIVRSKLRFISRPTQEDIQSAVQDDALIVVRIPVPERWRKKLPPGETFSRIIGRCNATLHELDLVGGHPRVVLLADTCDSRAEFTEKVYGRFGA